MGYVPPPELDCGITAQSSVLIILCLDLQKEISGDLVIVI